MSVKKERTFLLIWLVANLAIGLWIVRDFGLSFDESNYYRYADLTFEAYRSFFGRLYEPDYAPSHLQYYGPAFILIVNALLRFLRWLPIEVLEFDVWHYAYFVTFQLTGLCLYGLIKRWFSHWTAWTVLVVFISQPLLWGHAFINPKDIPFMFFFTFSIWAGFRLVDSYGGDAASFSLQFTWNRLKDRWQSVHARKKRIFFFWVTLTTAGLAVSRHLALFVLDRGVRFLYNAAPDSWAGKLMAQFIQNEARIPVEAYVSKVQTIYQRFDIFIFLLGILFISGYLITLLTNTSLVAHGQRFWHNLSEQIHWKNLADFFGKCLKALFAPKVILAGVILGLTTSVRILGPLAGVIVMLYLFIQIRQKSFPLMVAYAIWAGVITYLSWPFLWLAPVANFSASLSMMSQFPWQGRVLFNGAYYTANELPASYIPTLLNIQFTEIMVILWYLGLGFFVWRLWKKEIRVDLLLYIGLGFLLPLIGLIALRSPLYDNFRQLFFLVPAMFSIAAFFLQAVFGWVRHNWMRLAILIVIILPGVYSIWQYHPYQYIYYNALVGSVKGAACCFETDYWRTSMREMVLKVNDLAEPGEKIIFKGASVMIIDHYFRPDLIAEKYQHATYDLNGDYDYAILHPRYEEADYYYPDAEIIATVELDGVVLGVIKEVKGQIFR